MKRPSPTFRVGDVFPSGDKKSVLLARFLVASQSLASLARIPGTLPSSAAGEESGLYLMVLSIGAANEAAIAFREADDAGVFADLEAVGAQDLKDRVVRLRVESDRNSPSSLRSLLIRTTRDKLGFHWDLDVTKASLVSLAGDEIPVYSEGNDTSVAETTVPFATAIIDSTLTRVAGSQAELPRLAADVAQFQGDCFHVAHAAFGLAVRRARESSDADAV